MEKHRQQISQAEIDSLVEHFYRKVREDSELGPVFNNAVEDWGALLALLKDFWSTVLLGTGRYRGNPLQAHLPLPIEERYFGHWLKLFAETAHEVMPEERAKVVVARAEQIAGNLKRMLGNKPSER